MKELKFGKFSLFNIILLVLLVIRLATQIIFLVNSYGVSLWTNSIYIIFSIAYLFAIIGIVLTKKWGSILVILIALIDLAFALGVGGVIGIGAGIVDVALIFLVFMTYFKSKKISKK